MRGKDKTFFLWLFFLIVGVCCTAVLLFGRFRAEIRDGRVAAAVYYDDVVRLAQLGGRLIVEALELALNLQIQLVVLVLSAVQAGFQLPGVDIGQHIVDGVDAHLHPRVALPQQLDGVFFDHVWDPPFTARYKEYFPAAADYEKEPGW